MADFQHVQAEAPDAVVGEYRVVRLLGDGDSCTTYEVEHRKLRARAVLKVLHRHLAAHPDVIAAFRDQEDPSTYPADAWAGFVGSDDCALGPYVVTERAPGQSLLLRLQAAGGPIAQIEKLVFQIASSLLALHEKGRYHGDLHPNNVLLHRQESTGEMACVLTDPRAADVLAAAVVHDPQAGRRSSPAREYLAPEVLVDARALSPAADVYSLGVILFHGLTATLPPKAGEPLPQERLGALAPLLRRMLHAQPRERPSLREVAEALGPRRVGDYALLATLDDEDTVQLHTAVHLASGQCGTLKVIAALAGREPKQIENMARSLQNLGGKGAFATIHRVDRLPDGRVLLFMEPLPDPARNRAGMVCRSRQLHEEALHSALTLAQSVAAAHQSGLLLLGLNPDAVLLLPSAEPASTLVPRLLDLTETAQWFDATHNFFRRTIAATQVDRPSAPVLFLAPEQCGLAQPIGPATDVYALGALIYFLFAGLPVFDASQSADAIAADHRQTVPRPLSDHARAPEPLVALLARMLEKDAKRRPSMEEVALTLEGLTIAREVTTAQRSRDDLLRDAHFVRIHRIGAMGVVLCAELPAGGPMIAVKVPLSSAGSASIEHEARVLAQLKHPGLPEYLGCGRIADRPFMATRFISGVDLATHLAAIKRMPERDVLHHGHAMSDAMAAAHRVNVLHRDLAPDNIVLKQPAREGERPLPIIVDFGTALSLDAARRKDASASPRAATIVGKHLYMAPEQRLDADLVTDRADVYALGVVLYEMLAGAPPPAPPLPVVAGPGTMRLLQWMTHESPERRPSMEQVRREVYALLHPAPSRLRPIAGLALAVAGCGALAAWAKHAPARFQILVDQPDVSVIVGKERVGSASPGRPYPLRLSRRAPVTAVVLEKPGYHRERLLVDPAEVSTWFSTERPVSLRRVTWSIQTSQRDAHVKVDGSSWMQSSGKLLQLLYPDQAGRAEDAAPERYLKPAPATLAVEITAPCRARWYRELDTMEDFAEPIELEPARAKVHVVIRSEPRASVTMGGVALGDTPLNTSVTVELCRPATMIVASKGYVSQELTVPGGPPFEFDRSVVLQRQVQARLQAPPRDPNALPQTVGGFPNEPTHTF